jgi:UDP-N-acetylmuramoylalanine--D-glutamate ligase
VPDTKVFTFDQKDPSAQFNNEDELLGHNPEWLIVSPGIPLKSSLIQKAVAQGIQLTSELEVAFEFIEAEKIIAITGSVGKSTTTALLGQALSAVDADVFCGGNLGQPLAQYIFDVLSSGRPRSKFCVLELSSYQLELFRNLRADASVITFLSPNHLERYPDLNAYYQTKLEILKHTSGPVILNENGGDLKNIFSSAIQAKPIWTKGTDALMERYSVQATGMVGAHNLDNFAMALAVLEYFKLTQACLGTALDFRGLPHRLEKLGTKNGITFVNDSKATTMDSVLQGVNSVLSESSCRHLHLLLGGRDKNMPWSQLSVLNQNEKISFYFFGECGELAQAQSRLPGERFLTLLQALDKSLSCAQSEDWILMSPGGTSLDAFKNFEERGNFFRKWFLNIQTLELK